MEILCTNLNVYYMSRRDYLEKVIIGTLLESNGERNYFDDCRCVISQDMFKDDVCRRLYGYIVEMNKEGKTDTRPSAIFELYGSEVMDIVADMVDLCTDYSFIYLKTEYNEKRYLAYVDTGILYGRTDVQFADYVTQFLKLSYESERKSVGTEDAAA